VNVFEELDDPTGALARTLTANGWVAASLPVNSASDVPRFRLASTYTELDAHGIRLAGASVDGEATIVTELLVLPLPTTLLVRTRLPVMLPASRLAEAARLCATVNAYTHNGVVSIEPDGAPRVTTTAFLFAPESAAAAVIAHAVRRNRTLVLDVLLNLFLRLGRGETAAAILADTSFVEAAEAVSNQAPSQSAARFDFERAPEPTFDANGLAEAYSKDHGMALEEGLGFARYVALADLDGPVCVGPVLLHQDGIVECYGCTEPLVRSHPPGTSMSCMPGRELGPGHRCGRCAGEPGPTPRP
jgi:hypothetical protein